MKTMRTLLAILGCLCLVTVLQAQAPQLLNDRGRRAAPRDPQAVPEGLAKSDWQNIRAAYEAGRHAFQPIEGGWQTRNPGSSGPRSSTGAASLASRAMARGIGAGAWLHRERAASEGLEGHKGRSPVP